MADEYARLRWRCRRGMRELDAVLEAFLKHDFAGLDKADKHRFEALLDLPDPELHAYLVGRHEPRDPDAARLLARMRRSLDSRA
ncbi:MAG TPA: succinate dehydrogenase assembly factor 2 [Gammaproteobacteria bacterium]|nr:succinate dehydrogenase assembly factor 2 [Gammaproteobacteria bacterium]